MIQKEKLLSFITFAGFVFGILYTNLIASDYLSVKSIFNEYYLQEFIGFEVDTYECLFNIIWIRMAPVIFLLIVTYSNYRKLGVALLCAWTGFLWGIYMSLGIEQLGILGIVFCILGMVPHMLFYIPAYLILIIFTYQYPQSRMRLEKICMIILCISLGIMLEYQVNPVILKWFISVM